MTTDPSRRRRAAARNAELGGSVAAGSVGAGFGAAKLRDAHKESYPDRLQHLVNRHAGRAKRAGVSAEHIERTARRVMVGKPGFAPLAAATVLGATAAGASHYGDHLERQHRRAMRQQVGKALLPGVSGRGQETVSMTGRALAKRGFSLHDMDYDEVSLVDVPANQFASIMIAKSFQGADMDPDEIFDADGNPIEDESVLETGDVIYGPDRQAYRYTRPDDLEDPEGAETREPELAVAKRGNPLLGLGSRQRPVAKRAPQEGDLASAISKALGEATTEAERDEVIKSFAGAVGEMQNRLTAVEKRAEVERDQRLTGEYIEVAKALGIPGVTPEEFGPVLKRCGDLLSESELDVLSKALDATSGVLYEEFGYTGTGTEYGDPETADAEAYASDRVAKGGKIAKSVHGEEIEVPISKAQAIEMYYAENEDAYDSYIGQRR